MKVIEVNEGPKIEYTVRTTKITFDDELMLNLARYEQDDPIHIDVCADVNGNLTTSISNRYVAQIDIPAREYTESVDVVDGEEVKERVPVPFDMDKVTLSLFSLV